MASIGGIRGGSALTGRAIASKLALTILIVGVAAWVTINREHVDLTALEARIAGLGAWAEAGFVAAYALATVFFAPGSIFGLAGGALFGPFWGTVWNIIGASSGAALAFFVARYVASDWVERKAGGPLGRLKAGVEAEGWRFVAFVRLVPLFPFNLVNYALGLTRIPFAHYMLASSICMLPGTVVYTYLGYAGREALGGGEKLVQKGIIGLALLATLIFLPRLVARLRGTSVCRIDPASMKQQLDRGETPTVFDVRGADEFRGELGHIPGSLNVPLAELSTHLPRFSTFSDKRVVVVCRTDKRSASAAELLARAGWRDVEVLQGGMQEWNRLGLPVER